jgi:transcription-repair coupling factor (superfamily II helicase)
VKAFIEPLQELSGYEDMTKAAMQPGLVTISGCIDAQKPHMIYTLGRTRSRRLIVTFHEQKAKELYDDYRFFDPSVVYYPAKDVLFYQSDIRGNLLTAERISALRAIHENEQVTVITTFDSLCNMQHTVPHLCIPWHRIHQGIKCREVSSYHEVFAK